MNNNWVLYISNIEKEFTEKCNSLKKLDSTFEKPKFNWSDSKVQERLLRIWNEYRDFDLDIYNPIELEKIAIATLKEDFIKRNNYLIIWTTT